MKNQLPQTRLEEWREFSVYVHEHIEKYANSQYNDKGMDNVTNWSIDSIMAAIEKYIKRYKSNQRPGQEQPDLMKIAHYACMAFWKYEEEDSSQEEIIIAKGTSDFITRNKDELAEEIGENVQEDKSYEIILREK